jgi:hypothetical protein
MGIWLFDANELQALHQLIMSQRAAAKSNSHSNSNTALAAMKPISLTDLLSTAVSKKQDFTLEERLRTEFSGHNFGDVKEFARAVARFITLDPSTVAALFGELRK